MAIVLLFYKHSSAQNSEWMNEISKNGIDAALSKFCRQIPVSIFSFLSKTKSRKKEERTINCKTCKIYRFFPIWNSGNAG